tara:strand:- start:7953 stop:8753 length:801 start_codon:yes stop_codon:yes gene_type:complete
VRIVAIDPNKWRIQLAVFDLTDRGRIIEPPTLSTLTVGDLTDEIYGEKRTQNTKHKIGMWPMPGDQNPSCPRLYNLWFEWAKGWVNKNLRGSRDWFVVEKPDHAAHIPGMGTGGKAEFDGKIFKSGSPNALTRGLCDLSVVSGALVIGASYHGGCTRLVEPREWKGNKRKSTTYKEVEEVFGGRWANDNLLITKGKDEGNPNYDLSDACGLGLWWQEVLKNYKDGKDPDSLTFHEHDTSKKRRAARAVRRKNYKPRKRVRKSRGGK